MAGDDDIKEWEERNRHGHVWHRRCRKNHDKHDKPNATAPDTNSTIHPSVESILRTDGKQAQWFQSLFLCE
jgi:hypothetical protein